MQTKSEMQQGWDFAASMMGASTASQTGHEYVGAVEAAIKELEDNINYHTYRNLGYKQLQGYMLEEWGAGTFNVDAVAAGSDVRASVLHENTLDSVDIQLSTGDAYSAKSYATPDKTVKEQARLNTELQRASYEGQGRLVPSDQLDKAKEIAKSEANQNAQTRTSEAYDETAKKLTDKVTHKVPDRESINSRSATRDDLENMAKDSHEQDFHADKYGVAADNAITTEYMLRQALEAGYTAAAITAVMQLAPEIFKAIDYLIKNGEMDLEQLQKSGTVVISASAEGFLRGSVASALMISCQKGAFGEIGMNISPSVLGIAVVLVMQTVKNSILVAAGRMTKKQMGEAFVDTVVTSAGFVAGVGIGNVIGPAIGKAVESVFGVTFGAMVPVVGYLLGSLIGTSFCVLYNVGKKRLISFCVDTGFTCFGLVEQDYELPEDALHELGVDTIPVLRTSAERTDIAGIAVQVTDVARTEYETIDIQILRRGVIGVNKVGYVL